MLQFHNAKTGDEIIVLDVFSIQAIESHTTGKDQNGDWETCTNIFGTNYTFQVDGTFEENRKHILFEIDRRNKLKKIK